MLVHAKLVCREGVNEQMNEQMNELPLPASPSPKTPGQHQSRRQPQGKPWTSLHSCWDEVHSWAS